MATTGRAAQLLWKATVTGADSETGAATKRELPAGRAVWADDLVGPHSTMNGGGWDATITDLDTGWTGKGRVR